MQESTSLALKLSDTAVMTLNYYLLRTFGILNLPLKTLELGTQDECSVLSLRLIKEERAGSRHFTLLSTHLAQCGCVVTIRTELRTSALASSGPMRVVDSKISGIRKHTETPCLA